MSVLITSSASKIESSLLKKTTKKYEVDLLPEHSSY